VPQKAARFHSSCAFGIDRQDETLKIARACMRYLSSHKFPDDIFAATNSNINHSLASSVSPVL
jgi:hypothetical protein